MATIEFLPDRLNTQPVVFRGFTVAEMFLTAGFSALGGLIASLPIAIFAGWVVIPSMALILPLIVVFIGGKYLARLKRGKPDSYLYRKLQLRMTSLGFGEPKLILKSGKWALRRNSKRRSGR